MPLRSERDNRVRLTVFGATGGVGTQLVGQALDSGHAVTAFVREPATLARSDELVVIVGRLDDYAAVEGAIDGADVILSALGARRNTPDQVTVFSTAMANITRAMQKTGVKRLVAISGAGVIVPGDTVTLSRRLVRFLLRRLAAHIATAKEREYEIVSATDLDWTLVRPPRIVPGPATGRYRVFAGRVPSPRISQGDVAHFMLRCVGSHEWVRKAPILGY